MRGKNGVEESVLDSRIKCPQAEQGGGPGKSILDAGLRAWRFSGCPPTINAACALPTQPSGSIKNSNAARASSGYFPMRLRQWHPSLWNLATLRKVAWVSVEFGRSANQPVASAPLLECLGIEFPRKPCTIALMCWWSKILVLGTKNRAHAMPSVV